MLKQTLILSLGLIVGCSSPKPDAKQILFDTKMFWENQITELQKGKVELAKVMVVDGKRDSLYLDSINWESELSAFVSIDLSKPAYAGRFSVDSTTNTDETTVHYQRKDASTDLEHIWMRRRGDQWIELRFEFSAQNEIYASTKLLVFYPGKGFEISGKQSVQLGSPFSYQVKGSFVSTSNQSPQL